MAVTPPPRAIVHTPPTPLHGAKYDNLNPRKSTRQSTRRSQRAVHTTPPPAATIATSRTPRHYRSALSPPSSASTSPQTRGTKRRREAMNGYIDTANGEASSFGSSSYTDTLATSGDTSHQEQSMLNPAVNNMLPTPAKTPRKKDLRRTAELQSAARVLFPGRLEKVEDAMPNIKKRRGRRNVGFSLDSSGEDEDAAGNGIPIFTDSKEKVPELDTSEENPFIDKPTGPAPPASGKGIGRRGRSAAVSTNRHIEDVFNREEGMVYVFRGKKIFRPFPHDPDNPNLSSEETEIEERSTSPQPSRPFTRASVKPRLLFPTEKQRREREFVEEDEEALTDIEEHQDKEVKKQQMVTPTKQSFTNAPATPPTTGHHATRSSTRKAVFVHNGGSSSPLEPVAMSFPPERRPRKKTSPFDGWARTKTGGERKGGSSSRKRGAEHMDEDADDAVVGDAGVGSKRSKASAWGSI